MDKTKTVSSGKIDVEGLKKVGKGALIAGAGAVLTYVIDALPGVDLGVYAPMIVAASGILINFLRKFLLSYKV